MPPLTTHHTPLTTATGSSPARRLLGFTLIELTVVLAIIAVVMGSVITLTSASLEGKTANDTMAKLKILQQALLDYRIANNKLPCPANSTLATSNSSFGVAAATTTNCTGGSPAADTANASAAVGMVPVRTLGLPDDMAVDSWGRRIRYAVSPAFVSDDAFDGTAGTLGATTARMTVNNNDTSSAVASTVAYVLISHGKNGHGAYPGALNKTTASSTPINAGITNANELLNCKCDSTGAYDSGVTKSTFVQGDEKPSATNPLDNFDDIVVFATRAGLRDATE